ncbi:MAG: nucleotidyltransferase family protein [bacterium]
MKAIILAGGLGTRLRPLTHNTPKPLLPIKGKPIMQFAIENLVKHGIKDIILSVGYKAEEIMEYFGNGSKMKVNLSYSIEDTPLGTGGAVKKAAENVGSQFILIWGDNLMDVDIAKMIVEHENTGALITMALTPRPDIENFGVANIQGDKIISFIEKPKKEIAPDNLINAGAFIINKKALDILPEGVSSIEKQCFELLALQGMVRAFMHKGQWFPTDTIEKYELANKHFPQ